MAHKKSRYDAACYYGGKLMGRCTVADSDSFKLFMDVCKQDAARVLREYAYFSPELQAIFEKVAAIQTQQSRGQYSPGLYSPPKNSPWGEVQHSETLCPGVFMIDTASHGGIMVSKDMTAILSPAARKEGMREGGYLCFEEDCDENIVFRELLDKKMWAIPDRIKDKAGYEERLNNSIREYHPDYWRTRQAGLENHPARQTVPTPAHNAEL